MEKSIEMLVNNCSKCGGTAHVVFGANVKDEAGCWVECYEYHEYSMHGDKNKCSNIGSHYKSESEAIEAWNRDNPVVLEPCIDELVSILRSINSKYIKPKPVSKKKVKSVLTAIAAVAVLAIGVGTLVKIAKHKR